MPFLSIFRTVRFANIRLYEDEQEANLEIYTDSHFVEISEAIDEALNKKKEECILV